MRSMVWIGVVSATCLFIPQSASAQDSRRLAVTGGSDYHGPGSGRTDGFGRIGLPQEAFDRLAARTGWRPSTS